MQPELSRTRARPHLRTLTSSDRLPSSERQATEVVMEVSSGLQQTLHLGGGGWTGVAWKQEPGQTEPAAVWHHPHHPHPLHTHTQKVTWLGEE